MTTKRNNSIRADEFLEALTGGPLSLAQALLAIRQAEGWSQAEMGQRLGLGRAHVCDIEKGRRLVSPGRAARFARILKHSEIQFVRLALQDQLRQSGIEMTVSVNAA